MDARREAGDSAEGWQGIDAQREAGDSVGGWQGMVIQRGTRILWEDGKVWMHKGEQGFSQRMTRYECTKGISLGDSVG